MVRTRHLSAGTVGKTIPCANTPSSNRRLLKRIARAPSPTITGVIGVSLFPVLNPSCCKPRLKKEVFSHRRSTRLLSSSRISKAAIQVATTDGGCEVLKSTGRARCNKKSRISWLHATYPPNAPIPLESVPICNATRPSSPKWLTLPRPFFPRSEEHTSELQSLAYLVCRLLLEKKKKNKDTY